MNYEFQFSGGCRDGKVFRSYGVDEPERQEAARLWKDFDGAPEGTRRPVLTSEVRSILAAGKHKDTARIKEHAHTYQVVEKRMEHEITVVYCRRIMDDDSR